MALRKASSYSKKFRKAYTRKSNVRSKNYIKTVAANKITKFVMGDTNKFNQGKYPFKVDLISEEDANVRDNALESARQLIHRHLEDSFKGNFYFIVSKYPHHVLRENKMLTGAGADRMQTGMTLSFGVPIGIAAQVRKGEKIFGVAVADKQQIPFVRSVLKKACAKMPCATKIVVSQNAGS